MKKRSDFSLDFTPWQWELAIVASRFQLGLLSDEEIIAFTHKLMNKGFYDDVMLEIINDKQIFDISIKEKFIYLWKLLKLPKPNSIQIQYIITFFVIHPFAIRPFNLRIYDISYFEEFFYNCGEKCFIDYDDIEQEYYLRGIPLDEIPQNDELSHYINVDEMAEENVYLFLACENWLNRNQAKILEIMENIYEK